MVALFLCENFDIQSSKICLSAQASRHGSASLPQLDKVVLLIDTMISQI